MNEINRLIRDYARIAQGARMSMEDNPCEYTAEKIKEYDFIVAALREKAEREKGCGQCNDKRCSICRNFGWFPARCKACAWQSLYRPQKVCAYCGRRLEVKQG